MKSLFRYLIPFALILLLAPRLGATPDEDLIVERLAKVLTTGRPGVAR